MRLGDAWFVDIHSHQGVVVDVVSAGEGAGRPGVLVGAVGGGVGYGEVGVVRWFDEGDHHLELNIPDPSVTESECAGWAVADEVGWVVW